MVFDLFGSLRSIAKLDQICIDDNVFRLHYKATVVMLIAASILVTGRQYFGDPIDCISRDDVPSQVLDTFCWIHATFTLPGSLNKEVGKDVPAPGVDTYRPGDPKVYHKYYQWVCFVLFIQAVFFYLPRYLWKMWEGGRIKSLVLDLNCPIMSSASKEKSISMLSEYLRHNLNNHATYFYCFFICEILNFVNVIVQMYAVDAFLGGAFSTYGLDVLRTSEAEIENRVDPMVKVFPRLTKCTFHRFGPSGDVQKYDAMCILPLNIINEKIYIFLWFWMIILAIVSGIILIYRITLILFIRVRYFVLKSRARLVNHTYLRPIINEADIGGWFLLHLIAKNIDSTNFRDLIRHLWQDLNEEGGQKLHAPGEDETKFNSKDV